MLLIYPPISKPCEPPPGIAMLLGVMKRHGLKCRVLDANLEGQLALIGLESPTLDDAWTRRAARRLSRNLAELREPSLYRNLDRYKRAVMDVNRLLEVADKSGKVRMSLTNFQHHRLSPVSSNDLIRAAETPEDNPFFSYFKNRLTDILASGSYSIVGISLNFLSQAVCSFAILGYLRKEYPGLKLVLGGGLVTSWMRRPDWKNPFGGLVDHLVAGAGEQPLMSILGTKTGRVIGHTVPSYNEFPLDHYLAPGRILPYSASLGCYWNKCAFCPERAEGNPYLPVPVADVVSDLNSLAAELKPSLIHILDNAISPSAMMALCKTPPGVPWYAFARITPHLADLNFTRALHSSGCAMLKLGIESGDQGVLDREQKGMDIDLASRAIESIHKAGIATYVYLLFGTPSETAVEARKTLEFTIRHSDKIRFLNLAIFNLPIHGTESRHLMTETHYEGDLALYTGFAHPKGWNRGLVRQFLDKEFRRHPAVAGILRNDPPMFTSNHAPFFCGHAVN